ncbi:hypothetical protein F4803DRAFT_551179 [Xylaria telfairii]|nr:hypothetical protein F4803DRAFT_551179 [Xylaria telfairii]
MVAFKSLLALAAYLGASNVLANPVASPDTSGNSSIDAVNPFSGVSVTPFSEKGCKGDDQGNTNIDPGTTDCVNLSNAGSTSITGDRCRTAYFETYEGLDCKGKKLESYSHSGGCYDKTGKHASARVYPRDC